MLLATKENIKIALNNILSDFALKITSYVEEKKRTNKNFHIVKLPKMFIYAPTSRILYIGIEVLPVDDNTFNPCNIDFSGFEIQVNVYLDKEFSHTYNAIAFDTLFKDFQINNGMLDFVIFSSIQTCANKYYFEEILPFDALADSNFDIVFDYAKFETIPRFCACHSKSSEARRSLKRNNRNLNYNNF